MRDLIWRIRRWWAGRPYAPWWLLGWLDEREYYCWAELATWKMCESDWPGRNINCVTGPARDGKEPCVTCYCGYWDRVADGTIRRMRENQRRGLPTFAGSEDWSEYARASNDGRQP